MMNIKYVVGKEYDVMYTTAALPVEKWKCIAVLENGNGVLRYESGSATLTGQTCYREFYTDGTINNHPKNRKIAPQKVKLHAFLQSANYGNYIYTVDERNTSTLQVYKTACEESVMNPLKYLGAVDFEIPFENSAENNSSSTG